MSFETETFYRVIVDHNGACGNFVFTQDVPIDLPESIINTLKNHVTFIDDSNKPIKDPRTKGGK